MKSHYIRISTIEQNIQRQEVIKGAKVYVDKISGSVPLFERPMGKKLKTAIEKGSVTELYVHSIDRLGRNTLDILTTINYLKSKKINLISKKEGIQTIIDGKANVTADLLINILATLAEFENTVRKERQMEGIAHAKLHGVYTGRKLGTKLTEKEFVNKYPKVVAELKKGESIRRTAKLCDVSISTVQKLKKLVS